jgi:hypothetical protein
VLQQLFDSNLLVTALYTSCYCTLHCSLHLPVVINILAISMATCTPIVLRHFVLGQSSKQHHTNHYFNQFRSLAVEQLIISLTPTVTF